MTYRKAYSRWQHARPVRRCRGLSIVLAALAACGAPVEAPPPTKGSPVATRETAIAVQLASSAALGDIAHVWLLIENIDDPENPQAVAFVDMPGAGNPIETYPFNRELTLAWGNYRFEVRAYDSPIAGQPSGFSDAAFNNATLLGVGIAADIALPAHGGTVNIALVTLDAATTWGGVYGPILVAIGGSDSNNDGTWDIAATIRYTGDEALVGAWTDDCAGGFGNAAPAGTDFDGTAAPLHEVSTTWTDPNWPTPTSCTLTLTVEEDVGSPPVRHRLHWTVNP